MYVHARTWYYLLGYFRELIIRFVLCRMQGNSTSGLAGCSIAYHVHWRKRTPLLCASPTQRSGRYTRIQNGTSFIRLQQRRICPQDQWRLLWNCRHCLNDIELVKLQFCCFSSTLPSLTYIFVAEPQRCGRIKGAKEYCKGFCINGTCRWLYWSNPNILQILCIFKLLQ